MDEAEFTETVTCTWIERLLNVQQLPELKSLEEGWLCYSISTKIRSKRIFSLTFDTKMYIYVLRQENLSHFLPKIILFILHLRVLLL